MGRLIMLESSASRKKLFLTIGVGLNLALLGVFKYADFIIQNANFVLESRVDSLDLVLPLAISFFTFQQIAYLADNYKGESENYSLSRYMLFVTFFPQLIAGPIVHHKDMMPQFESERSGKIVNLENVAKGLVIFSIGLFKKLVVADYFGTYVDIGYSNVNNLDFWGAWSSTLGYTIQLYYDFSGYCDMAMGAALFFNIRLPVNFNSPYKAKNLQDFWRRWHITLSTWLRDYLYIPLGGNRIGEFKTYRNLFITFALGGIWHGAGWGFLMWGAMHGVGVMIHRAWGGLPYRLPASIAWMMTILWVHFSWVLFRADNLDQALTMYQKMLSIGDVSFSHFPQQLFLSYHLMPELDRLNGPYIGSMALFFLFVAVSQKNSTEIMNSTLSRQWPISLIAASAFLLSIMALAGSKSQTFLYFNF